MKKLLLAVTFLASMQVAIAQPWIENYPATNDIKTIEANFKNWLQQQQQFINEEEGKDTPLPSTIAKEGYNYHYERWKWYWDIHSNTSGLMQSPLLAWQEYNRLKGIEAIKAHTKTTTNPSNWTFAGPDSSSGGYSGIGRINVVAFHPTNAFTYIVGAAGGGCWRTTNDGLSWTSLYDDLPVLGVSDIDYNPLNPNTIYLCTGDRDASDTYSIGLLKSYDNGATWNTTGSSFLITDFTLLKELIINPQDTNSLTLATSKGIFKSNNGGTTFSKRINGNFDQVVYHPTDTTIIYATGRETGNIDNIYKSTDGGYTWTKQTNFAQANNIRVAVTAHNPAIVKAVVSNNSSGLEGIYSSSNTGQSFTKIYSDSSCTRNILSGNMNGSACGGQGWYDLSIAISPVDSNLMVVGGINTWVSTNGGYFFKLATQWYSALPGVKTVHADKHYHAFQPNRAQYLFECNDGGIYRTTNPTSTLWDHITNKMGITQFYRNAVSNINPAIIGGSQDNGSKRLTNGVNRDLTGGDGMNCEMDPIVANTIYTAVQNGVLYRSTNNGVSATNISNNIPVQPTGAWITPYAISPFDNNTLIAGYKELYISPDKGNSWSSLGFTSATNCLRLSLSTVDAFSLFASFSNTNLTHTPDMGTTFLQTSTSAYGNISDLLADLDTASKVWVTFSSYTGNKVGTYNFLSNQWVMYNDSLPKIPIRCITIDTNNRTQYVGTDFGVYYKDTTMKHWEKYSNGLPNIEVTDLGIDYTQDIIVASTYGRGMWKSPRKVFPPLTGISMIPYSDKAIEIFPNPNKGTFQIRTAKAWASQKVRYKLYNTAGVLIKESVATTDADGSMSLSLLLTSANYLLELYNANGEKLMGKMLVYE